MAQQIEPTSDDDSDRSIAGALEQELSFVTELLKSVTDDDVEAMSDVDLVDVRTKLKELEDTVEDVRKEQAEDVLEDRVSPGEKLHGLHRVESHNKYVDEDAGTVIMRAVSDGVDYTDFVSLDASALAESDMDVEIGRYEYTYFR